MRYEAVVLDLGGVVTDIDFRRVFNYWAKASGVPVERFYERWQLDEAYERHEIGALDFRGYTHHLSKLFDAQMPLAAWRAGWNDLFVGLFDDVMPLLKQVSERRPLYAFTNTNATHEHVWRQSYPQLDVFEHIFVSSRIGRRKPDVAAYHYVTNRIGVAPSAALFLDDNKQNIEGALQAGLDARLVASEGDVVAQLKSALDT